MQEVFTTSELDNLDLSKGAALQQKRTLAFINHFVITTVPFLNSFMKKCENKLMLFERKLEKLEAAVILLETRLSSIPEANIEKTDDIKNDTQNKKLNDTQEKKLSGEIDENFVKAPETTPIKNEEQIKENLPVQNNQDYERFVKMVQVGVPLEAVKLKVSLEGLDPNILQKILNK